MGGTDECEMREPTDNKEDRDGWVGGRGGSKSTACDISCLFVMKEITQKEKGMVILNHPITAIRRIGTGCLGPKRCQEEG